MHQNIPARGQTKISSGRSECGIFLEAQTRTQEYRSRRKNAALTELGVLSQSRQFSAVKWSAMERRAIGAVRSRPWNGAKWNVGKAGESGCLGRPREPR